MVKEDYQVAEACAIINGKRFLYMGERSYGRKSKEVSKAVKELEDNGYMAICINRLLETIVMVFLSEKRYNETISSRTLNAYEYDWDNPKYVIESTGERKYTVNVR